MAAK
jgi:hypothetical protein